MKFLVCVVCNAASKADPRLLSLILLSFSLEEVFRHETVKQAHPGLFKEIGSLAGKYKIALKDEILPFALSVPRRVAIPLLSKKKTRAQMHGVTRYNFASQGTDRLGFRYGGGSEKRHQEPPGERPSDQTFFNNDSQGV